MRIGWDSLAPTVLLHLPELQPEYDALQAAGGSLGAAQAKAFMEPGDGPVAAAEKEMAAFNVAAGRFRERLLSHWNQWQSELNAVAGV